MLNIIILFYLHHRTMHWVRGAAPIIIHVNLDTCLHFLVSDTHYRNRFETGTSGGSLDKLARMSWEVLHSCNQSVVCLPLHLLMFYRLGGRREFEYSGKRLLKIYLKAT